VRPIPVVPRRSAAFLAGTLALRTGRTWARAAALRCRALLAPDDEADALFGAARSDERGGPPWPDDLTPQELRVALAVAEGASNKEVATALFLSPRTVESHLANVFRKAGMRSRSQLARALVAARPLQAPPS
jgi:DNA-binding NarL/FixJ family response regulator